MIRYRGYLSIRRDPINIKAGEEIYFANAKEVQIPDTNLFIAENASILKDHIFQPSKFSFYAKYSHILRTSALKQYKKMFLYFLPGRRIEEGAWITDEWSREYFHWFTDALSRLLIIEEQYGKGYVILPERYRSTSYVNESLAFMGWRTIYYDVARRVSVRKLFMASHTAPNGNYNKEIMHKLRSRLSIGTMVPASKFIYVSRKKAAKRKVSNEEDVVELLVKHDVEICCLEEYSFEQTIQKLSGIKCLIGLHGAGLTNMLFMQSGGMIVEFRNEHDRHNNAYFALASDLDHQYYYIRGKAESVDNSSDVHVDISELEELMGKLTNLNN
jgi:capsular polysaccharide biosynthesis protein